MSGNTDQGRERLLQAYVDGLLGGAERDAFERKLMQDPDLRADLERQRMIDGALQRLHEPREEDRLIADIERRAIESVPDVLRKARVVSRIRSLAVAAVLALGLFGVWRIWDFLYPPPVQPLYVEHPWRPMDATYQLEVEAGLMPDWVCKTDRQFAGIFRRRLGQPLLLAEMPAGISAGGLAYRNTITPNTIVVLARIQGKEALVFVDRADADAGQSVPPASGLNLFRRQLGTLVLYEVSELDRPYLLERFYVP